MTTYYLALSFALTCLGLAFTFAYQRLHVLPTATVQHVQLLRTPRVPQGSLGQLLRTRITRSPRTLPRRLLGPLGTLARLRPQRPGRRLHCSPPPNPDPLHSNHPPHSTRHRQCKPYRSYGLKGLGIRSTGLDDCLDRPESSNKSSTLVGSDNSMLLSRVSRSFHHRRRLDTHDSIDS